MYNIIESQVVASLVEPTQVEPSKDWIQYKLVHFINEIKEVD